MARLKFKISEEFMRQIVAEAELLWPGGGIIAIRRLVRDSLRRLWRYCGGMIELDMVMEKDLITKTHDLAVKYFGDDSDASLTRVLEVAFKMRSFWSRSIKQGQQETGEAVSMWEFPESATTFHLHSKTQEERAEPPVLCGCYREIDNYDVRRLNLTHNK